MRADFDPYQAVETRRTFLDRYCETDIVVCGTHFPEPSFGHIEPRGDAFWFAYRQEDPAPPCERRARALKPMQDAIGETGHHGTLTEQQL
jgi:hypothetical protein